ncbi:MAG: Ig-like domain-containing protein [Gammaproteobacteria bacterium]|nr:Ig-like domain-containing protein [Gammaproteobacteria bacterium]
MVASDGLSAIFTPDAPLQASTLYRVRVFGMQDLAGNVFSGSSVPSNFTTSDG